MSDVIAQGPHPEQAPATEKERQKARDAIRRAAAANPGEATPGGRPAGTTPQQIAEHKNLLTRWGRRIGRRENRPGR